ncbi:aminodeoxychorismate synthase component I [Francisellaceae bacterium]|nr:aminodeoxychorismate synthase component I [Francisellaceae bacterium]
MMQLSEETIRKGAFCFLENSIAIESYIYLFTSSVDEMIIYDISQLSLLFSRITRNQQKGLFAVGYFSYESGIPKNNTHHTMSYGPIAHFVFYEDKAKLTSSEIDAFFSLINQYDANSESIIYDLSFNQPYKDYEIGFNKIQQHLLNGDSYQVNYTAQYQFKLQGSTFYLYQKLRAQQLVSYGAYLPFSSGHILSFSPELFFTKSGNKLKTKPMKGTIHRCLDSNDDDIQKKFLQNDGKNRAENLIIVDLLRNDMARIAETGSVKVNKLFDIETYQSVHQMTSEIEAKINPELSIENLFQALFPCGSITGAPKKKTMEIITQTEKASRGLYTGCIGYVSPDNDMSFNVAIRTIQFNQHNEGVLGVGGGITTQSNCMQEWQEMHLKGQFFIEAPKNFELIETLLFDIDYVFFEEHINRLSLSCQCFGFKFLHDETCKALLDLAKTFEMNEKYIVRVLYNQSGAFKLSYKVMNDVIVDRLSIVLSENIVDSKNILYQHKTTASSVRGLYNNEQALAAKKGFHDVFFQNEKGFVTETSRYNIVYKLNGKLYTPPIDDGLLPGIYRQNLINQKNLSERSVSTSDLLAADEVFICNSVRGLLPVNIFIVK